MITILQFIFTLICVAVGFFFLGAAAGLSAIAYKARITPEKLLDMVQKVGTRIKIELDNDYNALDKTPRP